MADREEMRIALEDSQRDLEATNHQLEKATASSKKKNSSAWKLRQEVSSALCLLKLCAVAGGF